MKSQTGGKKIKQPYLKIGAHGTTKIVGIKNPKIIKVKHGDIINYEI